LPRWRTVLVGFLSTNIKAEQQQLQDSPEIMTARFGVCETPGVAPQDNLPPGTSASLASLPPQSAQTAKTKIISDLKLACDQSLQGFDAAYRITFYASVGALILAIFLPGWPGKWLGRGSTQGPMPGGH